ncbi:MAG: thioredoxin domain-containing protein [Calditrichia bacterium]
MAKLMVELARGDKEMNGNHHHIILTDQNFQAEVIENSSPILVEIRANWSGSCHILAPVLEELADNYKSQIRFGWLDIDSNEQTASEFGVDQLPFILFFRDGRLMDHLIGLVSRKELEERIKILLRI